MSDIYKPLTTEHAGFLCYHCGKETRVARLDLVAREIEWWKEKCRRLESSLDAVCAEHAKLFDEVKLMREDRFAAISKPHPANGSEG